MLLRFGKAIIVPEILEIGVFLRVPALYILIEDFPVLLH